MRELGSSPAILDGLNVVLVSFYNPEAAKQWMQNANTNFPMYIDSKSDTYDMLGFHPTFSLGLKTVFKGIGLVLTGRSPKNIPGERPTQMGGDMITDKDGKILYLYRSVTPDDRPSVRNILNLLPTLK